MSSRDSAARCVVVWVTCPTRVVARRIAAELIKRHVAACVTILPEVESVFWWDGKADRASEALLMIKTTLPRFEALRRLVVELHPYDVPEVIACPIASGHPPYLRWVAESASSA